MELGDVIVHWLYRTVPTAVVCYLDVSARDMVREAIGSDE